MSVEIPKHVAIIMDGNGRWAKQRGWPRYEGHRAGADAVRRAIEFAVEHDIEVLTLFALSVENHECRPQEEVQFLLSLLLESLQKNTQELHEKNVRIRVMGDRSQFNDVLTQQILETERLTYANSGLTLVLAINYGGRWDIVQASRRLAQSVTNGAVKVADIDEAQFASYLSLANLSEPDLLIRTSDELRLSNFMLWQLAYTELFFTEEYWPDFDAVIFQRALDAFAQRERRFGYASQQAELRGA